MDMQVISTSGLLSEIAPLYVVALFLFAILAGLRRAIVGEDRLLTLNLQR